MKIYVESNVIKLENYQTMQLQFPNVTFTDQIADSYDCDYSVTNPGFLNPLNLAKYPNLKYAQNLMAGFNTIDLGYLHSRGIIMMNARDVFSKQIAEDTVAKILVLNRNIRHYLENMKTGTWKPLRNEPELTGSMIGILGTGSIAQEIAKRLKAFDMRIIGYRRQMAPSPQFDRIYTETEGLNELLRQSDYVVCALPLNAKTAKLMDATAFSMMKPTALFINIARGEIVDQEALVDALRQKKIRGAALDVTTPEPLPADHPLWQLENCFITPHNASASQFMVPRLVGLVKTNIAKVLAGDMPLNIIEE